MESLTKVSAKNIYVFLEIYFVLDFYAYCFLKFRLGNFSYEKNYCRLLSGALRPSFSDTYFGIWSVFDPSNVSPKFLSDFWTLLALGGPYL